MNCTESLRLLGLDHDGRLSNADRAKLDDHVHGCAACAEERRWLARLSDVSGSLVDREVPPDLAERIASGVLARPAETPAAPRPRFARFAWAGAMAATLVIGVATGFALSNRSAPIEAGPSVTQRDESAFRRLLLDRLGLTPMAAESLIDIRRRHDALLVAMDRRQSEERARLEKAEIEELWKALDEPARKRLAALDPHSVPEGAGR